MTATGPTPALKAGAYDDLKTLLAWRRDVRRFRTDALPDGLVAELLRVAGLAPSVGLSQPWRWVLVDDPARRAAVRTSFQACNGEALAAQPQDRAGLYARLKLEGLDQAPCQIAVFSEPDPSQGGGLGRATMPETAAYSTVMAIHTLWLAARAAGVGVGWVSILDPQAVIDALQTPAHWTFIGYLCLGYPEAESDTPELERAGWERRAAGPVVLQR